MGEDEYIVQPVTTNNTVHNTHMKISQQNALAIQNLANNMTIIKINP